jgi:tetratricopeptide (TPR) repeat protein
MPPAQSTGYSNWSARVHWLGRDFEAVVETLNNPIWMKMIESTGIALVREYELANAWRELGDEARATAHFENIVAQREQILNSAWQGRAYGGMTIAISLARLGRLEEALVLADELTTEMSYEKDSMLWGWLFTHQAMIKGLAGDRETAVEDLKVALDTPTGLPITAWALHYHPNWDFMRDYPAFVELATPDNLIRTAER